MMVGIATIGFALSIAASIDFGVHLMRRLLVLFVAFAVPALLLAAPHRVTVSELAQIIDDAHADHLTDAQLSQRLNSIQLTESLNVSTWQRLTVEAPGAQTTEALRALYAASAFLPPPSAQVPSTAAPSFPQQRAIMSSTIDYVVRTIPSLPNLIAVRDTAHYTDTGVGFESGIAEMRGGLLLLGEDQTPVTIRDGVETDAPTAKPAHAKAKNAPGENFREARDLVSWGEFGPVLTTVLTDAAHGQIAWSRWQLEDGKKLAVFHFIVPRSASHYSVHYCCDVAYRPALDGQHQTMVSVPSVLLAGYHGELAIEPETGIIRRIQLTVDPRPGESLLRGAMMIEWGPVAIGSSHTTCPLHGVTLTTTPDKWEQRGIIQTIDRTRINETEFADYHRFGSQARIITDLAANDAPASQPISQPTPQPVSPLPQPDASPAAPPSPAPPLSSPAPSAVASVVPATSAAEHATPAAPELTIRALDQMPPSTASDAGAFTLHATTERVNVNLLALDRKGQPVTNLRRDEIQLFDNGRLVPLATFQQSSTDTTTQTTVPTDEFTNVASSAPPSDTLILLLDDSHLPFIAMNQARQQVLQFLQSARSGTRFALYAIDEHGFRVIQDVTEDPALVRAKLAAWTPSAASTSQAQALERRDRQEFDTVHHAVDLNSVNGNYTEIPDYVETTDPELRLLGDNPQRQLLEGMQALARHFAAVSGQKSLALISGDSALGDWEDRAVGMEKGSRTLEPALLHAREALNDAHIALYVIDASQNSGGSVDSSIEFRNVELIQGSTDNNGPAGAAAGRNLTPGRLTGQMQANAHGIDAPVRTLAESTGGLAVRRGTDLAKTLDQIQADQQATAELSFEPPSPPDNTQHIITIQIPDRKGLKLRYRASYLDAAQPVLTPRQQLQRAVWSPEEARAIDLTAATATDSDGATLRLRIALKGLDLRQQTPDSASGSSSGTAAGRWTDQLLIFVATRSDGTHQAQISGDTLALSLLPATYQSGMPAGIPYKRTLKLPSKLATVRVIVIDRNSGRMGSVTLPASAFSTKS